MTLATTQQMPAQYADIMAEVRARALSIIALANQPGLLPTQLKREYGFLQLRMCCELIALGCLVIHGKTSGTPSRDILNTYQADKIMKMMTRLHPRFYPVPKEYRKEGEFGMYFDSPEEYMTKDKLRKLYATCGDNLHRRVKDLVGSSLEPDENLDDIVRFGQEIFNLLSIHTIESEEGHIAYICELNGKHDPVMVHRLPQPEGPPPPPFPGRL